MSGDSFGRLFRVTTFGESHGVALGCIVEGCPPGLALDESLIQADLERRRPGRNRLMSARAEADAVRILSGTSEGKTLGTALALLIENTDHRPKAYDDMAKVYRPSHADFTYHAKYGHRARSGGGRASARETAARVAAGAIARHFLAQRYGIEIIAWVESVGCIQAKVSPESVTADAVAAHVTQCPDPQAATEMETLIEATRKAGNTIGGVIGAVARNVPAGWGEPVFDKLEATLAHAMLSIPACKGFESGSGFAGTHLLGHVHNDPFALNDEGQVVTRSNHSGGIQGGISNGMPITLRAAFKPVATHFHPQETLNENLEVVQLQAKGRHDPCVLPRAVVIVEAMMALCLADAALQHEASLGAR